MEALWAWKGRFFGFKDGNDLWTYKGHHVGKFYDNEIYDSEGKYLGRSYNGRLITKIMNKNKIKSRFTPYAKRMGQMKYMNYMGFMMLMGYEDFPELEGI